MEEVALPVGLEDPVSLAEGDEDAVADELDVVVVDPVEVGEFVLV